MLSLHLVTQLPHRYAIASIHLNSLTASLKWHWIPASEDQQLVMHDVSAGKPNSGAVATLSGHLLGPVRGRIGICSQGEYHSMITITAPHE